MEKILIFASTNLSHVGAVGGGSCYSGVRGEPNLVVDHDVDGAVSRVVGQVREMEGLVHHPLP